MKKVMITLPITMLVTVAILFLFTIPTVAKAAEETIEIGNNTNQTIRLKVGDTGKLIPVIDINIPDIPIPVLSEIDYDVYNPDILSLSDDGSFKALKHGSTTVTLNGYSENGTKIFYAKCYFNIYPDMTHVTLEKSSTKLYLFDQYNNEELKVNVQSTVILDESDDYITFTYTSSNKNMYVNCRLSGNVLSIQSYSTGTTTITININEKTFTFKLQVIRVRMSANSAVLALKQTKQLKVKGFTGKIKWSSSNPKIARISSKGLVKARKKGNVIITAKVENGKVGCVISVTTSKIKKAINLAKKIAKTGKYSQAKRMQSGYYDCSALVWKAYSQYGKTFGSSNYAPVAADIAKWCASHGKTISKSLTNQVVQKRKCQAGDLVFGTGSDNNRYKGIYHVEMFVGYSFKYFDSNGKAVVNTLWANRGEAYGYGGLLMRP